MVKKTIAKILAVMVVIALSTLSFSACNFIKENETRVANQELITINGANGITMTLTQNEIIDYYNIYAYYLINNYGYTVEEALDFAVESKIKNKYLITIAMGYLVDDVSARNVSNLYGGGKKNTVQDVLTYAEYYAAIKSVNDSMKETLDSFVDESYQQSLNSLVSKAKNTEVDSIEFAPSTLEYLKDEYYVNQDIDTDKIKFVIVYDAPEGGEKTRSAEFIVPTAMYETAFTSKEAKTDLELTVKFEEKTEKDGDTSYETHKVTHTYDVVSPRATETKTTVTNDDDVKIGDITVNRYATLADLQSANAVVEKIDVEAEYNRLKNDPAADTKMRDAYRQLNENLKNSYKTMDYLYGSAFESAVVSALQVEVKKTANKGNDADWDSTILQEFKHNYNNAKDKYAGLTTEEALAAQLGTDIKSNLDSFYYYPALSNLSGYFYVYQILVNFSETDKTFLTDNKTDDKDIMNSFYEFIKDRTNGKESNPAYNADYDCPVHELGDTDAECKWEKEKGEDETGVCPSIAYIDNEVAFTEIYNSLQTKLQTVYNNSELTDAQKSEQAFSIFKDYMYRYNDDPGTMNSSTGYLIAPEGVKDPNGFYQSFLDLAHDVYDYSGAVGNAFTADGKLGYTFTDYGVHIIMVSMTPFENVVPNTALTFSDDAAMLDYIKTTKVSIYGKTIYEVLKEKVITDAKTQAYSQFTNTRIKSDLKEDESAVKINEKKMKKLYELYVQE